MKYNWKSVKLDDATFQKLFESKQNYHILLHFFLNTVHKLQQECWLLVKYPKNSISIEPNRLPLNKVQQTVVEI